MISFYSMGKYNTLYKRTYSILIYFCNCETKKNSINIMWICYVICSNYYVSYYECNAQCTNYITLFPSPVFDVDVPVLAVCLRGLEVQRYAPGEAALVQEEGHPNLHGGPRP